MAPSSSLFLHGYTSRCSPKLSSCCVEADLEIIDLDVAKATPKSSQLSRTRFIQSGNEALPGSLRLRNAEADRDALRQKMESLEDSLAKHAHPRLQKALQVLEQEQSRVKDLRQALELVNRDMKNTDARAILQGLSKAELCEVRQLARNPPEHVRRTLFAIWLVLNSDRFRDKTSVHINDGKDWALCQKMLADKTFVSRLHSFDPSSLDEVPHVLTHLARTFFGMESMPSLGNPHVEPALHRRSSDCVMRRSLSGALSLHASISGSLLSKPGQDGRQRAHTSPILTRPSLVTKTMSSLSLPHLPLDQHEVQHASEPCGALLRWLRTLVLDRARRACIQRDLQRAEDALSCAEKTCRDAELQMTELQTDVELNRKLYTHQEETVVELRSHLEMDRKRNDIQDQSIQALQRDLVQTPLKLCALNGAWNNSGARMRPRSRCSPPNDITLKTLTCQNGTWRETFERYSVPGSPSWSRFCAK